MTKAGKSKRSGDRRAIEHEQLQWVPGRCERSPYRALESGLVGDDTACRHDVFADCTPLSQRVHGGGDVVGRVSDHPDGTGGAQICGLEDEWRVASPLGQAGPVGYREREIGEVRCSVCSLQQLSERVWGGGRVISEAVQLTKRFTDERWSAAEVVEPPAVPHRAQWSAGLVTSYQDGSSSHDQLQGRLGAQRMTQEFCVVGDGDERRAECAGEFALGTAGLFGNVDTVQASCDAGPGVHAPVLVDDASKAREVARVGEQGALSPLRGRDDDLPAQP
ncbi:hypothetical protein C5E07_17800 [Pseudoclavibacter sp. RFBJ3]|nr:hypothetical protein C5C12_00860 [Pseudoclavibacter sp. RFBJ5]PPF89437.1 hypothetical protein C5E07_17800 [Pseudoclavibacter sp. RFBJ3]